MGRRMTLWALFCFLAAFLPSHTDSIAVMSVDLGSEWMKIAIVKPGVPMEIVLNRQSRRKTPVAVCLKENERLFEDGALGVSAKNPKLVFRYLQGILGKTLDNPQVALYQKRFPEHQLEKDEVRGTVLYRVSDELRYSPEEILGMVLNYSRSLAQEFAEQPIKDVVITVPAFFNQAERRAVLQAAQMADLKVLQLINDNTAVALNYGVFRRKDINSTAQNVMFYDMGSESTVATIVTYQSVKTKDAGTQPQLQIRGVGFDRTLGGFEMELRLRDHLAKLFNEQKKSKKDVRENVRAMAKLLKEANRLKTVLSANVDHMAQVEGLLDDIDFKSRVTRAELEELCADLLQRVPGPVQQALSSAELTMDEIESVILVGGATRVPKVQELLLKAVGKEELSKNINADEAAAMGAVYQAAALSKAFKVKPFLVRDAAIYPIQVEFTRDTEEDEEGVKSIKHNKRVLFQRMSPYPQRKVITFNRYTDDFQFNINYGDVSFLSEEDLRIFGPLNLTTVQLSGVGSSFKKHADTESKGIKAHFNMDESGLLSLDRVESVFETIVEEKDEESTLTKLGNTISSLFGGGSSEPKENGTEPVQDEEESQAEGGKEEEEPAQKEGDAAPKEKQETGDKPEGEAQAETKAETKGEGEKSEEKTESQDKKEGESAGKEEEKKEEGEAEGQGEGGKKEEKEEEKQPKPKMKSKISEEIGVVLQINDVLHLTAEQIDSSKKKLQDLTDRDLAKHEREKILNTLEAFIFETQDKLEQEEFQAVLTGEEKEQISGKLSEASGWLDEDGYSADTKELKEKLSELRKLCKALFFRVEERRKWPDRLAALDSMLNHTAFFLKSARQIAEDEQIFTEVELNTLEKVINETTTWKNATVAEQEKRPATERPVLLSKDIEAKLGLLDREVKYLLNKAKFAKPKPKAKPKDNSTKTEPERNGTAQDQETVIQPTGEEETKTEGTEAPEPVKPADEPPTAESDGKDTSSQPEPTEPLELEATPTPASTESSRKPESHVEDEL
ncbi:hypoxia up-regulated protein 1-like [Acipenser ruthenus]|uniref:hypoxia up-regulated protein 1-like n=1 Tax=Acipenser ruthenus TaxID=7906 RepID=UPI002741EA43|nr:hypoxia up-regulated protein 1-like [Acipenser ruthenus]